MPIDFVSLILEALSVDMTPVPRPFELPYQFVRRVRKWERRNYGYTIQRMKHRGLITVTTKNGKKFVQCTKKGQLKILFEKACLKSHKKKDGFIRLLVFDIPESSKSERNRFRHLLKQNDFRKLQASVYTSPYPMNRSAIGYLKETGLIDYIRIFKVIEADDTNNL